MKHRINVIPGVPVIIPDTGEITITTPPSRKHPLGKSFTGTPAEVHKFCADSGVDVALEIINNAGEIVRTNYFSQPQARSGLAYLSINAGILRLLIPATTEQQLNLLNEVQSTVIIVAKFGHNDRLRNREGVALWFDDATQTPFRLDIEQKQCDRKPPTSEHGKSAKLTIYTEQGKVAEFPARIEM